MSQKTQAEWPRMLLAIGFITILVGVGIGAATDGSPVAQYVALVGLLPIGMALVGFVAQRVLQFRESRRLPSGQ